MRYEQVKNLPSHAFKRLVGVRHQTFRSMVWVMRMHAPPKLKSGRPSKLSLEDQVLVTLQYPRSAQREIEELILVGGTKARENQAAREPKEGDEEQKPVGNGSM